MRVGGVLAAALSAVACAGSGENSMAGGSVPGSQELVASVEAKVTASSVRFVLHVTNSGAEPVEFRFSSSQRYDFIVETAAGEEVWRWSDDMMFLQALSQDTLSQGESWDMEAVWDPEGRTGQYVVTGVVTARDHELRQRAAFELQ